NPFFPASEGSAPRSSPPPGPTPRRPHAHPPVGTAATLRAKVSDPPGLTPETPEPTLPPLDKPYAVLVTGIGGTGVVTVSAVLAEAAHLAGLGFGSIDVTGLAQKGGAVACHMRIARSPEDIHAIRVGTAHADLLLGGDLVVTAANKILDCVRPGHTAVVYSTHEVTTGDFTRHPELQVPGERLNHMIRRRAGTAPVSAIDAQDIAVKLFGDSLYANMLLVGMAWQLGRIPIPATAIEQAIRLNGAAVETNLRAFQMGRQAAHDPVSIDRLMTPRTLSFRRPATIDDLVAHRAEQLVAYQDQRLAERYRTRVDAVRKLEAERTPGKSGLAEAVARSYFKLLATKDEYEVARLYTDGRFEQQVRDAFDGVTRIELHLAPPLLARRNKSTGEPIKMRFGPWVLPVLRQLAKLKGLRGSAFDPFGYTAERRMERQLIADYERMLDELLPELSSETHATLAALAAVPQEVKGFGHVKMRSLAEAKSREADLRAALRSARHKRQAAE
ncbi:MAG: DUF6537 domain-containing protein, partial [Hyphomicrobium sp.]